MNQHVRSLPSSPRPSAPAAPDVPEGTLTFQWERLPAIARELPPLFKRHYDEIAVDKERKPLEPDWPRYYDLALLNILHVLTARADGRLVGYVFTQVTTHLHYASVRLCVLDMYWLDPLYRQGWNGVRMLRQAVEDMKKEGVQWMAAPVKEHFERERGGVGIILKRLGFSVQDVVYTKFLG